MAVYEILPTTNLKWDDIRDTLNANNGTVNNNAITAFQSGANINKWSKYKPVRLNQPFPSYDTYWKAQNGYCGLVPAKCGADWISDIQTLEWEYELPRGGESEPYRLGDFRGYNPKAVPQYIPVFPSQAYDNDSFDILFVENVSDNQSFIKFSELTDYINEDFYIGVAVKVTSRSGSVTNYSYGTSESVSKGGNLSVRIDTKASWLSPGVTCIAYCFLTDQPVQGGKIPSNAMIYAYPDSPFYERSKQISITAKPTYKDLFEVVSREVTEEYNLIRFSIKVNRKTTKPLIAGWIVYSYNIVTEYGEQWVTSRQRFADGDITITGGSGSTGQETASGIIRLPTTVFQNYSGLIALEWTNGVDSAALGADNVEYKR